jgi:Zn-finger nucleic acid-binding protein
MLCPECQIPLDETDYLGIRIDECPRCRGRWFDRDELRKAKDRTDDDLRWLDFDPFEPEAGPAPVHPAARLCPLCQVPMITVPFEKSGVVIDRCDECHGVWLRHQEFEKIVDYLDGIVSTKTASEYAEEARKEFAEIFAGPEGLISEIRDYLAVLRLLRLRVAVENPRIADAVDRIYRLSPFK